MDMETHYAYICTPFEHVGILWYLGWLASEPYALTPKTRQLMEREGLHTSAIGAKLVGVGWEAVWGLHGRYTWIEQV